MSLPLRPEHLAAAYEFIRSTPPFSSWKLPHSDEVVFTVNRHPGHCGGYFEGPGCRHEITISEVCVGHTDTLIRYMSHEMIHLHQAIKGLAPKRNVQHNRDFKRRALAVCKYHGWDERLYT